MHQWTRMQTSLYSVPALELPRRRHKLWRCRSESLWKWETEKMVKSMNHLHCNAIYTTIICAICYYCSLLSDKSHALCHSAPFGLLAQERTQAGSCSSAQARGVTCGQVDTRAGCQVGRWAGKAGIWPGGEVATWPGGQVRRMRDSDH